MIANSTAIVKSNKHETWTGSPAMKSAQISPAGHASHSGNGDDARWRAVLDRDVRQDGKFFYAVSSTGVFCRPSCPARRPRRGGVVFLDTAAEAERAGFRACLRCRPLEGDRRAMLVEKFCRYIETHADEPLTLAVLGDQLGVTPFHLQRTFKRVMGVTPREYAAVCRMRALKKNLRAGHSVTQALFAVGYGSTSRLYERSRSRLGMTPATYGRRGRGARIRYAITDSALGKVLLAATDKGVCCLQFGDSERDLVAALKREFAEAELLRDEPALGPWLASVARYLHNTQPNLSLPLDVRATAFQWRVWKYLQTIPPGTTQSYAQVTAAVGRPKATRAVARACASNAVAVAIPCHRVIRQDGTLGGYGGGLERKQKLLLQERQQRKPQGAELQTRTAFRR